MLETRAKGPTVTSQDMLGAQGMTVDDMSPIMEKDQEAGLGFPVPYWTRYPLCKTW
jgi:hypothetical protein